MIVLRPVISVRDLPSSYRQLRSHPTSIRNFINDSPQENESLLIRYLQQGACCEGVWNDISILHDVLRPDPGKPARIPQSDLRPADPSTLPPGPPPPCLEKWFQPHVLLTDGEWIWPAAVIYYVKTYHLRLDPEFVRHAESRGWAIDRSALDVTGLDTAAFTEPLWGVPTR